MSDRYKYTINGIHKCENFAEHVEQDHFPEIYIASLGGISGWNLKCTLKIKNGHALLYPFISCGEQGRAQLRTFFNVLKNDGSSGSMKRKATWNLNLRKGHALADPFDISELLNPENEWLDDGSLSIEYGIHVDAIRDSHKRWRFNFDDIVFNYTGEENQMVRCTHEMRSYEPLRFYCSAEILNFHCPQFVEQAEKIVSRGLHAWPFFRCLQILHGVRLREDYFDYFEILQVAHFFNFSNVIQYCDQHYMKKTFRCDSIRFNRLVEFNLRHTLMKKLRNLESKDVAKIAKELYFKEATGEVMKIFVAKILYT